MITYVLMKKLFLCLSPVDVKPNWANQSQRTVVDIMRVTPEALHNPDPSIQTILGFDADEV